MLPPFAPAPEAGASLLGYALIKKLPSALEAAFDQVAVRKHLRPCEVSVGKPPHLGKMVEHRGIAPRTPAWKAGVCLSIPMLDWKLESRGRVALPVAAC